MLDIVEHSRGELLLLDHAELDCSAVPPKREPRRWRKFRRKARRMRFTGLSALTGSLGLSISWNAQVALTGVAYSPTTNTGTINKRQSLGTQATNAQSGGCDEFFSFQQGVVAGGSATVNLNGMTDIIGRTAVTLARIKGCAFRLLSATDDPTISPPPTATSIGAVTNIGPATPAAIFGSTGSGLTLDLTAAGAVSAVSIGAAGTGYPKSSSFLVSPTQAGGSGCTVGVVTNGSGVPTTVTLIAGGAGYTGATVPSVEVGQRTVATGGFTGYADPIAAGFVTIDSTHENIKLINLDGTNAITFEVDVFGATS